MRGKQIPVISHDHDDSLGIIPISVICAGGFTNKGDTMHAGNT